MADKETGESGSHKFLNRVVAGGAPYLERFVRTKIAPYVVNSKPFNVIMKMGDPETMMGVGKALPGFWSVLVNEIPSEAFISREIGDTVKNITTIFFTEMAHALEGNTTPTPEQYAAAEEKAVTAVQNYFEQEVFYDRTGFWHFSACPNWQSGRQPAKSKLAEALELGRQAGTCCQRREAEIKAKAAEPAKAAEASKPSGPVKIPAGASVMDILGLMPEEPRKKLMTWLQALSKKKFEEVGELMTQHMDTVEEAVRLSEVEDKNKIKFLGLMKNRSEKRKSKIAEAKKELEEQAKKAMVMTMSALKKIDESVVSTEKLDKQKAEVKKLQDQKSAQRRRAKTVWNLWGML